MADRDERRAQAAKHLALMKGALASETAATVAAAVIYEDGEGRELPLPEAAFESTETSVTTAFAPAALRDAVGKTAVVDPTAFTRPGGNYEDGAFGPEQILCSESNLYPILCGLKDIYHDGNRGYQRGQLFTDRALYLSDVVFSHDGTIRKADVIAIPEPNRARALENHRSERECDRCLAERIEAILRIAAANGSRDADTVPSAAGAKASTRNRRSACSRIGSRHTQGPLVASCSPCPARMPSAFDEAFGKPVVEEVASAIVDEESFDVRDVELPEGVTLR
ncbi:MAG: TIGR02452 family protein [Gordonibacter pamelaeae]